MVSEEEKLIFMFEQVHLPLRRPDQCFMQMDNVH